MKTKNCVIIPANMGARQVQHYYIIMLLLNKKAMILRQKTIRGVIFLKGTSQPLLFPMPSKVVILHGEAKSYFFTVRCVSEGMSLFLK